MIVPSPRPFPRQGKGCRVSGTTRSLHWRLGLRLRRGVPDTWEATTARPTPFPPAGNRPGDNRGPHKRAEGEWETDSERRFVCPAKSAPVVGRRARAYESRIRDRHAARRPFLAGFALRFRTAAHCCTELRVPGALRSRLSDEAA